MPDLAVGVQVDRELKAGETHSYVVKLSSGQYLHVVVEQRGIDVVVRLFGPGGQKLTEVNSPNETQGAEPLSFVAEVAGNYRLEVSSLAEKAAPGRYEVNVKELRAATSKDRNQITAERALAEAEQFQAQGTLESLRKALAKHEEALQLWRTLGDRQREAITLNVMGEIYLRLGENPKALDYHSQAVSLTRAVGDRRGEGESLFNIGKDYWQLGDSQKALNHYNQALPLLRAAGDRKTEARILGAIGAAYETQGKLHEAIDHHNQALMLHRAVGNQLGEALALNNLGVPYFRLGEWQKALDYHNQALSLIRKLGDRTYEAQFLTNIGFLYWQLGENQKALEYHNQALQLRRVTGDRNGEAYTLQSIGFVYQSLGDVQQALEYYNQGLSLSRTLGERRGEANALMGIGIAYRSLGEAQKALDVFNQALGLRRAAGDVWGEAGTLDRIGTAYSSLGKYEEAARYLEQALSLQRPIGARTDEAITLANLARAEQGRGRLAVAKTQIEAALNIVESMRSKFVGQQLRTSFSASTRACYDSYINLLMQMHQKEPLAGHDVTAFGASERARARSLLDLLTESRVDIRQGVDRALLERELSLQQQLNARSEQLTRLLSGKHTEGQESAARKEVEDLLTNFQDVEAQIRVRSPRYTALTQPQPLSLKEIQQLLDEDTLLLEYALGEERSYLWAVTSKSIRSFELPPRAEIETAARRVYELLVAQADALYPEALTKLSRMLLTPVAGQLGKKRLLIVSEGTLQYIPFGALPVSESPVELLGRRVSSSRRLRATSGPLIQNHEIVSLPSASVVGVLRREMGERKPAPKSLAVLADPVFDKNDQRVTAAIHAQKKDEQQQIEKDGQKAARPSALQRTTRDLGVNNFDRLAMSRREADQITALASTGQPLKALDFAASRATAMSPELGQYRILHFATHSLLNNQQPELSGIVLSLVDEQGRPQDGFLRLYEIYNLKLEADLVVLSACQTALGKEIKGEGLVGLTRGFMYAGTPRVVASLWKVSDEATAELMKRFYQKMLKDGLRPAAALRAAQVSMLKEKPWMPAYNWAGFVLQGEWK
ncbi:MAG TPA: CHAT domain-containing protein [Blastocatellia bacterium]|nr:CHAT domain-containing protein [Blastocatellia bacterium]